MPIKRFDYNDILDETECVSCGSPNNWPVYRDKNNPLKWESCEAFDMWTKKFPAVEKYPLRMDEGLAREKVVVQNGFCKCCSRMDASFRFRGVFGWEAIKRRYRKGKWETYKIPHTSDRPEEKMVDTKHGISREEPEW